MKTKIISIICFIFYLEICLSAPEVYIINFSSINFYVKIYPVSMVFNGHLSAVTTKHYDLRARNRINDYYYYISGTAIKSFNVSQIIHEVKPRNIEPYFGINLDRTENSGTKCAIGFGKYRVDFYWTHYPDEDTDDPPDDYCTIEYDEGADQLTPGWSADVFIEFNNGATGTFITFDWGTGTKRNIHDVNRELKAWEQFNGLERDKLYGNYLYDDFDDSPYNTIPLDPRQDCDLPPWSVQNHKFFSNDIGVLTQNLTIKKSVSTPVQVWNEEFPSYPPINIMNGTTLKLAKGINNLPRTFTFKKYTSANYSTNLYVQPYGKLLLEGATNINEKAQINFEAYGNTEIYQYGRIQLGSYSDITLNNYSVMKLYPGSYIDNAGNSTIHINNGSVLYDCGTITPKPGRLPNIIITGGNPVGRYIFDPQVCNIYDPGEKTFDEGAYIVVDGGAIEIGNDCKFVFDGPNSYLQLTNGASILLRNGASLEFKNGAYLESEDATFINFNEGDVWSGIKFEDAGASTITNCTFTGAETYLDFTNTTSGNAANYITITGNSFTNGNVKVQNTTNCLISNNAFNSAGLFFNLIDISNTINLQPDEWSLNITDNQLTGGLIQIKLVGLAGNVSPFYVYSNTFNGSASIGLWGTNISGSFKNNNYTSADYYTSFDLISSDMDAYNNTLYSNDNVNVHAVTSGVKLAPVLNGSNEFVWYGGLNELNSANSNNLYFSNGSNAYVDNGNNCFTVQDQNYYHITGSFSPCFNPLYNAVRNMWNTDPPLSNVLCDGLPASFSYIPVSSACLSYPPAELTVTGTSIADMGNGIYDTVIITTNYGSGGDGGFSGSVKPKELSTPPVISPDKILYSQALLLKRQKDYAGSITTGKNIINNYDSSKYLVNALDILFTSYQFIDTIPGNNQQFTQLKEYLAGKIQQYQNNTRFTDKAYSYYLKSVTKLKQYSEAIAGYENMMNNHPDPVVRLSASWERAAIILLMGTGGKNEKLINNESTEYRKFIKKLFDNNPAHNIAKSNYKTQKQSTERNDRSPFTKEEKTQIENLITKYTPTDYKELAKRSEEDYMKMMKILSTHEKANKKNEIPKRYKLYQNYPNPFNPKTNITFNLPKDMDIKLTVYDVLGREIYSINEFRESGSNMITFDGSNLASGVYYYSLEAGTFAETRKMVLIK